MYEAIVSEVHLHIRAIRAALLDELREIVQEQGGREISGRHQHRRCNEEGDC